MAAKKRNPFAANYRLKRLSRKARIVYGRRRVKVHEILAALTKENAATFTSRHPFTYYFAPLLRSEAVAVSPQEARPVNLSKVTEARFLIVVGPLRIVSATMLGVAL